MSQADKEKWEQRYQDKVSVLPEPARVLSENLHLLPTHGDALDLACGRGGNALCLAKQGLDVTAFDIAETALKQLQQEVTAQGLSIKTICEDVTESLLNPDSFDVIVVSHFLQRDLFEHLKAAVKPGGLIFYQTFIADKPDNIGPSNPAYLLNNNELLKLFLDWYVCVYREEAKTGKLDKGFRNEAYIIAKKASER